MHELPAADHRTPGQRAERGLAEGQSLDQQCLLLDCSTREQALAIAADCPAAAWATVEVRETGTCCE